jgi:hypothetical protein
VDALKLTRGPVQLNGPMLRGYSALVSLPVRQGAAVIVNMVMITAASQVALRAVVADMAHAGATVHGLDGGTETITSDDGAMYDGTRTVTGQPPWSENMTRHNDLSDMFGSLTSRRRAVIRGAR